MYVIYVLTYKHGILFFLHIATYSMYLYFYYRCCKKKLKYFEDIIMILTEIQKIHVKHFELLSNEKINKILKLTQRRTQNTYVHVIHQK